MPRKRKNKKPISGVCRVCGCTFDNPCPEGCAWVPGTNETLCTVCEARQRTEERGKMKDKIKGGDVKNKLVDLNNHLFAQMERLSDEDLTPDKLKTEIERSHALTSVAKTVIDNARLCLDARVAVAEWNIKETLPMIEGPSAG